MKQILRLATVLFAMMLCSSLYAQNRVITGTVKDVNGKPLPFLAVQVKGTTIGTYTDTAGKFSLTVDQTAKTLVLSYPGMKTQEAPITDNMTVTMSNDAIGLSEVVVGAVGVSYEKKSLGYAVQTVGGGDVTNSGTGNMMNELEGKVSGLSVVSSAGDPGAGTFINLRGVTSLTGNNQPLIVVDGIPIDNSINNYDPTDAGAGASGANGNLTGGTQPTNRGLDINPNDIESITVLKGPAATALYGIEAANGAIVITTKKGGEHKGGGLGIDFSSSLSWSKYNKLPDMQNQWSQGSNGKWIGPTNSGSKNLSWGAAIDTMFWNGTPNAYFLQGSQMVGKSTPHSGGAVTPFNPYNFFQTGVANDNNISLSNGNDKSGFRISLGNLKQTGIIPGSDYRKTNFSMNGSIDLSKKLKLQGGVNYVNSKTDKVQQGSNISSVMLGLLRTPPTFDNSYGQKNPVDSAAYILPASYGVDKQRDYRGGPGYDNPYWTVNRNPFISQLNRVFGYSQANYHLLDWVDLTYRLGGDVYWQDDKNAYDMGSNAFSSGAIFMNQYVNSQFNSDLMATFKKQLTDKLKGSLVVGQNFFAQNYTNRFQEGTGFVVPDFLDMSNATSYIAGEGESELRRSAYYFDMQLGYADQLFLTVTGRSEKSSTLPAANSRFFYPSADLGWVFTEPLHLSTNKVFPYGKLRLSWAQVGKDAPVSGLQNYYHTAGVLDGFTSGVTFPFNGIPGDQYNNPLFVLGNPNLKPEKTASTEIGTDLSFFENRVSLSFTYYSEKSTDVILSVPVSTTSGFGAELANAGELTNKGEELTLNITPVKLQNGFQWDMTFNYSHNVNEVVQLAPGVNELFVAGFQGGAVEALPGKSFGQIYGTDYVHTTSDPNSPLVIDDIPGDPGYGYPIAGSSSSALASTQPKWIGGLTNTFTYKGITLEVMMSIRQGGKIWDGTIGAMEYFGTAATTDNRTSSQLFAGDMGHLAADGSVAHYDASGNAVAGPGAANTTVEPTNQYYWQWVANSFTGPTSTSIFDGSYVRISQINLGYDLPMKWIRKAHFTKVSLTLFATNPFLWTKYPGVDPETSLAGPANGQGLDYFNNPGTKSYGVRLNLGL